MDIDFISHFVQLAHGSRHAALRVPGTRNALREACGLGLLPPAACDDLLNAYDWLKRVECILRVFDMKNVSKLLVADARTLAVARAMGHGDDDPERARAALMERCHSIASAVRSRFIEIIGVGGSGLRG